MALTSSTWFNNWSPPSQVFHQVTQQHHDFQQQFASPIVPFQGHNHYQSYAYHHHHNGYHPGQSEEADDDASSEHEGFTRKKPAKGDILTHQTNLPIYSI